MTLTSMYRGNRETDKGRFGLFLQLIVLFARITAEILCRHFHVLDLEL